MKVTYAASISITFNDNDSKVVASVLGAIAQAVAKVKVIKYEERWWQERLNKEDTDSSVLPAKT